MARRPHRDDRAVEGALEHQRTLALELASSAGRAEYLLEEYLGAARVAHDVRPLHLQLALAYLDYGVGTLPVTEQLAGENFSVPIWAGIDADTQEQVVAAVRAATKVRVS